MDFWEAATADRVSKSMKGVREVCINPYAVLFHVDAKLFIWPVKFSNR